MLGSNEEFNASGDPGLAPDQAVSLECDNHLVNRWWADLEVVPHVGLGGRAPEHVRISVDEGQVLALFFGEGAGAASGA